MWVFLTAGFVFFWLQVWTDMYLSGRLWTKCVAESLKLLAVASVMLAYLQPLMLRRQLAIPNNEGRQHWRFISGTFVVATFLFAVLTLIAGNEWPEIFVKKWGDPARWPGMICLGVSALFFWFARVRGSRLGLAFWLLSGVLFTQLALGEMTVSVSSKFRIAIFRNEFSEGLIANLRLLDQGFNVKTIAVLAALGGLVALGGKVLSGRRRSYRWLLWTAVVVTSLVTVNTLFSDSIESLPVFFLRLAGCATAVLACHDLLVGCTGPAEPPTAENS